MSVTRLTVGPLDPRHKIVSAPVAAVTHSAHNWHACEINPAGEVVRVLCRVRPRNILDDLTQHNRKPVNCPSCARRLLTMKKGA